MKIKVKTLRQYELLADVAEMPPITALVFLKARRWLKVFRFPESVNNIPFERFIQADKYKDNAKIVSHFIAAISGHKAPDLQRLPAHKMLGLYKRYSEQFTSIYKLFQEQDDFITSRGRAKFDMSEFGLTNIISFLAADDLQAYALLMHEPVSYIFVEYRRKIKKIENFNHNLPKQS